MATYSISGNTTVASEIVYIAPVNTSVQLDPNVPNTTVTDASKNYTFSNLENGTYQVKTAGQPNSPIVVVINGNNVTNVNFSG